MSRNDDTKLKKKKAFLILLFRVSLIFPVRRRARADEATVCMLEPFFIETLWILWRGWTHCSRNVVAPVSLTEVSSSLLENGSTICNRIRHATSSATPADDGAGKCFRLFPVLTQFTSRSYCCGWMGNCAAEKNQLKYFRWSLYVLPSVFRAEV